jgi:excisionase family DNA binding protein
VWRVREDRFDELNRQRLLSSSESQMAQPKNSPPVPTQCAPALQELLTTAEVAHPLRVNSRTVQRWAAAGQLRAIVLPGGDLRIPRSELQRLMHGG